MEYSGPFSKFSKFNFERPLNSMTSKTAPPNILKLASNQQISPKDLYVVSRDQTKTKQPQQPGVYFIIIKVLRRLQKFGVTK